MKTSAKGIKLIKEHEGFVPYWYDDLTKPLKEWKGETPKGTLTIGYGHTQSPPRIGQRITESQGEQFLKQDLRTAELKVMTAVKRPLSQNEFDALVSWAYNTGRSQSDLYKMVQAKSPKLKNFWETKYITSKGIELKGLIKRRKQEFQLYQGNSFFAFFMATILGLY